MILAETAWQIRIPNKIHTNRFFNTPTNRLYRSADTISDDVRIPENQLSSVLFISALILLKKTVPRTGPKNKKKDSQNI